MTNIMDNSKNIQICNNAKNIQQSKDIFNRNFTNGLAPPKILYRSSYQVCKKNINLDKEKQPSLQNRIINYTDVKTKFIPGKGQGEDFLRNIDIDSELKRINYNHSKIPQDKYKPVNSNLIDQRKSFKNTIQEYGEKSTKNYSNHNWKTRPPVRMNYTCNKTQLVKNKDTNCLNKCRMVQCDPILPYKQPVLHQYSIGSRVGELQVGPVRCDHQCENIWNNVTKRRYI